MNRNLVRAVALGMALVCILSGCKKKEEEQDPAEEETGLTQYTLGEDTVAAMSAPGGVQPTEETVSLYTYEDLSDSGAAVADYVEQMKTSKNGFSVVDQDFVRTDDPDFTLPEGSVLLAKNLEAAEGAEPEMLTVRLDWSEGTCIVVLRRQAGTVTSPPPPEVEPSKPAMSFNQAEDFFKGLTPAALGLSGESMEDYLVYILEGVVLVDDNPCMRINVYGGSESDNPNDVAGVYFMTADGEHIYRLISEDGGVEEVNK